MARMTPQEAAAKWAAKAAAAQGDYQAGVERTSADPGQLAAAAADKWLANVQQAREKFRAGVSRVSAAEWKRATIEKGAPRYGTGVQQAQSKFAEFTSEFFPFLDQVTSRTRAMPSTTLEQRLARMVEQARAVSQFRRRGSVRPGG
jgi:hypothetical protein